jgi:hypothetical protein
MQDLDLAKNANALLSMTFYEFVKFKYFINLLKQPLLVVDYLLKKYQPFKEEDLFQAIPFEGGN